MKHIVALLLPLMGMSTCQVSVSSAQAVSDSPANILLILTDDQGWPTTGSYGGTKVSTPSLDRLAKEGATFTDAYVTSQCTPTRATLLTGQYTARHGLWHVLAWYGYPNAAMTEPMFLENYSRDTFTIAKGLRSAGYRTAIFGKWHLTNNGDGNYMGLRPPSARHYGFDFAPPLLAKSEFEPGADRGVETLTRQTIEFIRQNRDQPWFCFLSHHMIHGKVVAPEAVVEKYRRMGYGDVGPDRAVYLAGLECIDRSVGQLLSELDALQMTDRTLVIFLSDNGGIDQKLEFKRRPGIEPNDSAFPVEMVEYSNAPLRAGKGSVYEGGVRVPLMVRWPDRVPAGQRIQSPVHVVDLLPTCFEVAGAQVKAGHTLDGRSLVPLMTGQGDDFDNRAVFQYYPFYDLRWGLTPCASIRQGDYKLIEFFGDRVDEQGRYVGGAALELYDLASDLGETTNLAAELPDVASDLRAKLHHWMDDLSAPRPVANPRFLQSQAFVETRDKPDWLRDERWKPAE